MFSAISARRTCVLAATAALSFGLLVIPTSANAAGTSVTDTAPGEVAPPEAPPVKAPPVKVASTKVPTVKPKAAEKPSPDAGKVVAELPQTSTSDFRMVGVTWSAKDRAAGVTVTVRTRTDGTWSGWTKLNVDSDEANGRPGTEPLWIGDADGVAARVASTSGTPSDIRIATIDPGKSDTTVTGASSTAEPLDGVARATTTAASLPAQPKIITRAQWGAGPGTSCSSPTTGGTTRGVIVHHTAGSNSYDKSDSASILRGTQAYHVKSQGWCDIGYNFLVDKYGQIFEGRKGGITKTVRGAHAGNLEVNTHTMGVSMMGNYDVTVPSAALKDSMVKLISWRMGQAGLKAKGKFKVKEGNLSLNLIDGHRNVVSTACPGKYGYAWLSAKGGLRDRVEDALAAGGSAPSKPAAPASVTVTPSTSSAVVKWPAVSGAKTYGLCLTTSGASTTCARSLSGLTSTSTTLKDLKPTGGTDYFVKVRAGNTAGAGAWSASKGFNLLAAVPKAVTGIKVTPTSSSAKISWTAPAGAKSYGLCLLSSGASTTCVRSLSGLTSTSTTISGLKPTGGTDYFVKVRAGNGTVAGPWSALTGFDLKAGSTAKPSAAAAASSSATDTVKISGSTFTLTGHGFGHGIGMSQYGAQGAARDGVKYDKILSTYYKGTTLSSRTGTIRVLLTKDTTASVVVAAKAGIAFRELSGSSTTLPTKVGGKTVSYWRISPGTTNAKRSALQYKTGSTWATYKSRTWTGNAQFKASTLRLVLPGGSTAVYRGALRSMIPSTGSTDRNTVNALPIDDYVRGVVAAEMPSSWSAEALKAQAVAARTYGVRGIVGSRYYDLCDTTSCQVYRGYSGETKSTDAAVAATRAKILTYKGTPAFTQYSSSSGGWTAPGSQPYLAAVKDPYDGWSGNANHDWKVTVKAATLQKAYPKIGKLTSIKVKSRVGGGDWGGRVSSVTLTGSKSSATITGATMRTVLGLKSAWFRFS